MTDGPYRESRDLVLHERREIVLADEPASPSLRLRATDHSDGTTIIELHPANAALSGLVFGALTLCLLPVVVSTWTHGQVAFALGAAAVAVYAAARSLLNGAPIEEIAIGSGGLAFRRRLRREVALLEDVKSIAIEESEEGELRVALLHGETTLPLARRGAHEPRMERPEVEWLEGRLRRAVERARRQP
jgi:hypothetical protein